jgi:hypothetical protein
MPQEDTLDKLRTPVPEIIDPVFSKTSPKRSFSMTEYEHFGLVFTKTRIYKFGHCMLSYPIDVFHGRTGGGRERVDHGGRGGGGRGGRGRGRGRGGGRGKN